VSSSRQLAERLVVIALFAAGYAVLFRRFLFTSFDGAFGDDEDGAILLAYVEHWRHVVSGLTGWADPTFFFPQRGVLAYTDAYFLYGLAHVPLRLIGFDTFRAFMLVMSALAVVGYAGFYLLARRYLALPAIWAAVGAALFAFANMNAVKLVQAQSYCVMLLPLVLLLGLSAWNSTRRARGVLLAAAAGLLLALIFLTAFQTAWFFTLLLILFVLLHPVLFGPARTLALMRDMLGARRHMMLALATAFAIGIVPFLYLYLPMLRAGYGRDLTEVFSNAPDARDILNVTPGNWLWGEPLRALGITGRPNRPVWEVELGYTPAFLAVFCVSLLALAHVPEKWTPVFRKGHAPTQKLGGGSERRRWLLLLGVGVVVLWLLQLDYFGVRPWTLIWSIVPGASAVRYVFRSQIIANLFAAMIVASGLAAIARRGWARGAAFLLAALLLIEQVNVEWPATTSRRAALGWINAIPAPPAGCKVFYLVPRAEPADQPGWIHQAQAMLVSQVRDWPTVNGYATWLPKNWDLEEPAKPGYAAAVRDWVSRNGVSDLCGLDPRAGRWSPGLP